jgi:hypothetical protein
MTTPRTEPRTDWAGLSAAPFRPRRPQEARAKSALAHALALEKSLPNDGSPSAVEARDELVREAWERCAAEGLVPVEWIGSDRRWARPDPAFTTKLADGALRFGAGSAAVLDHPPSVAACVAMAADPQGVLAAEELGRFVLDALAPWIAPRALQTVVWRADGGGPEIDSVLVRCWSDREPTELGPYGLSRAMERAFAAALGSRAPTGWPVHIARMAKESAAIDALRSIDAKTAMIDGDIRALDPSLANPYHRAAELFAMGYGIERSRANGHLVLVAMPVR